jgi:hypothetical protein
LSVWWSWIMKPIIRVRQKAQDASFARQPRRGRGQEPETIPLSPPTFFLGFNRDE